MEVENNFVELDCSLWLLIFCLTYGKIIEEKDFDCLDVRSTTKEERSVDIFIMYCVVLLLCYFATLLPYPSNFLGILFNRQLSVINRKRLYAMSSPASRVFMPCDTV